LPFKCNLQRYTKDATLNGTKQGFCGLSDYNAASNDGSEGVLFATFSDRFLSGVVVGRSAG
jgi:hypothetical protein